MFLFESAKASNTMKLCAHESNWRANAIENVPVDQELVGGADEFREWSSLDYSQYSQAIEQQLLCRLHRKQGIMTLARTSFPPTVMPRVTGRSSLLESNGRRLSDSAMPVPHSIGHS